MEIPIPENFGFEHDRNDYHVVRITPIVNELRQALGDLPDNVANICSKPLVSCSILSSELAYNLTVRYKLSIDSIN
jgi:hypothetical protein